MDDLPIGIVRVSCVGDGGEANPNATGEFAALSLSSVFAFTALSAGWTDGPGLGVRGLEFEAWSSSSRTAPPGACCTGSRTMWPRAGKHRPWAC